MTTNRRRKRPKADELDEGDYINCSVSMQVPGDYETWVKVEAGTHVREGEDYVIANKRLFTAVEDMLDTNIATLLDEAG